MSKNKNRAGSTRCHLITAFVSIHYAVYDYSVISIPITIRTHGLFVNMSISPSTDKVVSP